MSTNWQDTSWQKEFLEMNAHKPQIIKLLIDEPKGFLDAWNLGSPH